MRGLRRSTVEICALGALALRAVTGCAQMEGEPPSVAPEALGGVGAVTTTESASAAIPIAAALLCVVFASSANLWNLLAGAVAIVVGLLIYALRRKPDPQPL